MCIRDSDRIVRPDGGPATADAISGARFLTIPGMGHQVHPLVVPRLLPQVLEHRLPGPGDHHPCGPWYQ